MVKRLVVIGALMAGTVFGQGTNTVFATLLSNSATNGRTSPVRNIGQTFHQVTVTLAEGSGTNCASFGFFGYIALQASYDNVNYFSIGAVLTTNAQLGSTNFINASGAYPYVVLNLQQSDVTACKITAKYAGAVSGAVSGSAPYSASADGFQSFTLQTASMTVASVGACSSNGLRMVVYSVILSNLTTTPNTVLIAISNNISGSPVFNQNIYLASGASFILPNGSRPYYYSAESLPNDFELLTTQLSGATAVSQTFIFRCET